jgi:Cdc6-like AAA superfamily ATPase
MFTDLNLNFDNFLNKSAAHFMFVDGYTGVGKTTFAKQLLKEFKSIKNEGKGSVVLTQAPYIDSEREFIISMLREEMVFYRNIPVTDLKTLLLTKLSNCKILVIDDSQNLLTSSKLEMNHFLFMSWLVNQINIKVLYLGTLPFQPLFDTSSLQVHHTINRRSIYYHLKAS